MNIVIAVLSLFVIVFVLRMVGLYEGMTDKKEGMTHKKKHAKKEAMENQEPEEKKEGEEEEEVEGMENFVPGPAMFDGKLGKKEITKTKV